MMAVEQQVERAFLDDIVAHPEDPNIWLIMADYLEDQNNPQAELVRLTYQLQYETDCAEFAARQTRLQSLLAGGMLPVRPRRTNALGMEFAWIPPGAFMMGSPHSERARPRVGSNAPDEEQHLVTISRGFWMGVHPVTQGQWLAVMGNNPSYNNRVNEALDLIDTIPDTDENISRYPVEYVSWDESAAFCGIFNINWGTEGQITLPTEEQWEYACRAGTRSAFHFGETWTSENANCYNNSLIHRPTPVGKYQPNAWGLYDMHGNVAEWCNNNHNGRWMNRGGSYNTTAQFCRSATRYYAINSGYSDVGFRVIIEG